MSECTLHPESYSGDKLSLIFRRNKCARRKRTREIFGFFFSTLSSSSYLVMISKIDFTTNSGWSKKPLYRRKRGTVCTVLHPYSVRIAYKAFGLDHQSSIRYQPCSSSSRRITYEITIHRMKFRLGKVRSAGSDDRLFFVRLSGCEAPISVAMFLNQVSALSALSSVRLHDHRVS